MHDARSVANFFLDRATQKGRSITVMTLLKVIYFAHAWHLAKYDEPLVAQPFEAWKFGPVNRVIYEQYKGQGNKPITKPATVFDITSVKWVTAEFVFSDELEDFLGDIFDYYSRFHAFKLSDLTHEAGGPWEKVWQEATARSVPGMIIPNSEISAWFKIRKELTS